MVSPRSRGSRGASSSRAFGPAIWRATRSRISPAALLVKVSARIDQGGVLLATRWAMRRVMTRVFPDPAAARMRSGPSVQRTALRWGSVRPSRTPPDSCSGSWFALLFESGMKSGMSSIGISGSIVEG